MTPARFWSGFTFVGLAVEAWGLSHADRNDWTASPNLRRGLRCNTPAGRAATTVLLGAGGAWLVNHLLSVVPDTPTSEETP